MVDYFQRNSNKRHLFVNSLMLDDEKSIYDERIIKTCIQKLLKI
jgi:hypothetical protein